MVLPSRLGCTLSLKTPNMGNTGSDVIADRWVDSDGTIHIEADVKGFAALPGVYTLMFWSDEDEPRALSEYSIFQ